MNTPLWILVLGLEFPAVMAILDCVQRPGEHFAEGDEDKRAWTRWLIVAIFTVPVFVGYGILLGYYYSVIRRNMPGTPT